VGSEARKCRNTNKKLSYGRDNVWCGCRSPQPKSIGHNLNLRLLNSPVSIKFTYALLIYAAHEC